MNGRKNSKRRLRQLWLKYKVCHICLKPVSYETATVDHIVPKSISKKLGNMLENNDVNNYALAHQMCNSRRGNDNGEAWLKAHPKANPDDAFVKGIKRLRTELGCDKINLT